MSKFNSETSFLYQFCKGNSNFILLKPCTVIYLSIFLWFSLLFIFIHMYIYAFIHLHINFLKPSRCLNSTRDFWSSVFWAESWRPSRLNFPITHAVRTYWQDCMYVCMYVCMYEWKKKTDKVTFDWCLSQLVVAVRLWSRTISYVGTEWGPQIWLCA